MVRIEAGNRNSDFPIHLGRLPGIVVVAVIYYAAARTGLLLAFEESNASPVWPPSGIALAALLLLGNRVWPGITLGAFAANLAVFSANHVAQGLAAASVSLAIAVGNTLEAAVGAILLRRFVGVERLFDQLTDVFKFAAIGLLMCGVSAVVGSSSLLLSGIVPPATRGVVLLSWWLGDVGGVLVIAPVLLMWLRPRAANEVPRSLFELVVSMALLLPVLALVFGGSMSAGHVDRLAVYLFIPCEAWAAYRYGRRGVALLSLLVAAAAVLGAIHGVGPFSVGPLNDSLILLVSFIALCSLTGLVLATDLVERGRLLERPIAERVITAPWLTLLAALGVTVAGWHFMSRDTERRAEARFDTLVDDIRLRISDKLTIYEQILRGGAGLFSASHAVEREEWRRYVDELNIEQAFPGVVGIGYAEHVDPAAKVAHVEAMRAQGFSNYDIWPSGERGEYTAIIYLEPLNSRNRRAIGYDMFSEPVRHAAMVRARDLGLPSMSGMVQLVQGAPGRPVNGFLIYVPIYRHDTSVDTPDRRRAALAGYVYAPFDIDDLVQGALGPRLPSVGIEVFDGDDSAPQSLMYASDVAPPRLGDRSVFSRQIQLHAAGHDWTLRMTSRPLFEQNIDRQKAQLVLIAGVATSLLLYVLVRSLALTRERALVLANDMTSALRDSEAKFTSLARVATEAIIIFGDDRRIVSANPSAVAMFGGSEGEMIGQDLAQLVAQRDRVSFDGEQGTPQVNHPIRFVGRTVELSGLSRGGHEFPLEMSVSTWQTRQGALYSAILRDISERKEAERALWLLNTRLALATKIGGIGVWEWDIKTGALIWDERMYEMYHVDRRAGSGSYEMWQSSLHEHDRGPTERALGDAVASNRPFSAEFRIVWPDRQLRTIKADGVVVVNESGEATRMIGTNLDITELRRAEEAVRVSEERFRLLVDGVTDYAIFMLDPEGRVMSWNAGAQRIQGYRAEQILGRHFSSFYTDEDVARGHPNEELEIARAKGRYEEEGWRVRKDGSRFWASVLIAALRDQSGALRGFGEITRDLTERKRVEATLHASLALQSAILDSANVAIIATDASGTILRFNRAAQRMLGYEEAEVVGRVTPELIHDASEMAAYAAQLTEELRRPVAANFESFVARAQIGQVDEREWTYVRKDGSRFPVHLSVTSIHDLLGNNIGFLGIATDISERKQKDQAIRAALAEKETLLKEVYHRVKNNLQVITSLFNLQLRALPEGAARIALSEAADRVRSMALVHEKLYQSQSLSSVALGDYVRDLCHRLGVAADAATRRIAVHTHIESIEVGLETAVPLGLVLNELISNSLKHGFPDGRVGEIRVSLRRDTADYGVLEVVDNGVGFPEGLDPSSSPSLGLKLVVTLSAQLDGKFEMESRGGANSRLRFRLSGTTSDEPDFAAPSA